MAVKQRSMPVKATEASIEELLAQRHSGDDWVFAPQVANATGMSKSRTADGVAMNMWPSRGLEIHGFEIKVSRSDWKSELNGKGVKADAVCRYCDRWWIVAPPGVVQLDELPKTWGLILVNESGLKVQRQAPELKAVPAPREFMAAFLRAAVKYHGDRKRAALLVSDRYSEGYANGEKHWRESYNREKKERETLAREVALFENDSGLVVRRGFQWQRQSSGPAVREVSSGLPSLSTDRIRQAAADVRRQADVLAMLVEQLDSRGTCLGEGDGI